MGTSRNGGLAFLSRGDIQMIGATTTTDEYQKYLLWMMLFEEDLMQLF